MGKANPSFLAANGFLVASLRRDDTIEGDKVANDRDLAGNDDRIRGKEIGANVHALIIKTSGDGELSSHLQVTVSCHHHQR